MKNTVKKMIAVVSVAALSLPEIIHGSTLVDYQFLEPLKTPGGQQVTKVGSFASYVGTFFKIFIGGAIALATIRIIIGGIQFLSTDAVTSKQAAKETIWGAVQGLAIVLLAWLILYTISPSLVELKLLR